MRNVLCLVMLVPVLALAAGKTQPLTALSPENGVVNQAPALAPTNQAGPDVPPKALIGTLDTIGGTTYDWWANGPMWRMLSHSAGKGLHALWMFSAEMSGTAFTDRNMRYNFYDYASRTWNWVDPDFMASGQNVFTHRAGYGNIDAIPGSTSGAAVVGCHYTGTAGITPKVAKDVDAGAGIFEYADGEPVLGVTQWPPISVGMDGQINIFPITAGYVLSYSRILAGNWPTFETPRTPIDPSPGFPTHNIAASKASSKIALAWVISVPVGGGVAYGWVNFSQDGGATWDNPTELQLPVAYGADTATSFHITSMCPWYDAQDKFHLVANLMPVVRDTGYIIPAQIWHYCPDNSPQWVKIHTAGCAPENLQASVGYNAMYACRPSIGQDSKGNLFVAWEQFDSANAEPITSRLRADIFAAASNDNGQTWFPAVKLTEAGTKSMRFPSVVDFALEGNPETLAVIYEIDSMAGFFVQTEGPATRNPVVVQKVPIDSLIPEGVADKPGSTPAKLSAVASPNPFGGRTSIAYALPHAGEVSLVVYDATGRPVKTLVSGRHEPGRYTATWDAHDAALGVYFYTLTSGKSSITRKMILAD
ncbi:T9SS type A sorting domain-containing protein [candidate division WOR-3 bacterium]|nr:T9SS type A sorting domain-containing protein [candidate division WOR-3 bacterium]